MYDIIYSSKLYKNSKYKDNIKSAVENPVNLELVQQLNDYIEDDSEESFDVKFSDLTDDNEVDFSLEDDFDIDERFSDDEDSMDESDSDEDSLSDDSDFEEKEFDITEIKDSLNEDSNCNGVVRISDDNDELWIHYNDKTNLNNIMEDVIEFMSENYEGYEFNRLARTENAIVFTHDAENSDDLDDFKLDSDKSGGVEFGEKEEE